MLFVPKRSRQNKSSTRRQNAYVIEQMNYEQLKLPTSFWVSTGLLLLVSVFLQRAVWLIRRERQIEFRRWLIWAWLAAVVFVFVQIFGMQDLLANHFRQTDGSTKVFGIELCAVIYPRASRGRRNGLPRLCYLWRPTETDTITNGIGPLTTAPVIGISWTLSGFRCW